VTLPFDEAAVQAAFDRGTFRRGAEYAALGSVRGLAILEGGRRLRAKVRGTTSRPYEVEATIAEGRGRRIVSHCTCPVGIQCKHGAALLLAALDEAKTGRAAPQPAPPPDPLAGPVGAWLHRLTATLEPAGPPPEEVIYILGLRPFGHHQRPALEARAARRRKGGGWGSDRPCDPARLAAAEARFVRPEDALIGRLMGGQRSPYGVQGALPSAPEAVDLLLERALATGRCHWSGKDGPVLRLGPERPGRISWTLTQAGTQVPTVAATEPGPIGLPAASPWYVDPDSGTVGRLAFPWPRPVLAALLEAPPVEPEQAALLGRLLAQRLPGVTPPEAGVVQEVRRDPPQPVLTLLTRRLWSWYQPRRGEPDPNSLDLALLRFDYAGVTIAPDDSRSSLRRVEGNRVLVLERHERAEREAERRLARLGLVPGQWVSAQDLPPHKPFVMQGASEAAWWQLAHRELPRLRAEGWRVEVDPSFRHRVVEAEGEWEAMLGEAAGAWFSLDLGVVVEGERIPLLPVLAEAIRHLRGGQADALAGLEPGSTLYARLPDGRVIALPCDRVRPLLETLIELLDRAGLDGSGRLDVSLSQALALAELERALRLRWLGAERLTRLVEDLRGLAGLRPAEAPPGLETVLRPYQRLGLAWMQHLARAGLGGLLADEMGLGKTVQTLAHVLAEKAAGRLVAPLLVVCPTSLVANWRGEAHHLAPSLRVLALHGPQRARSFAAIPEADLVLSTYALLPRDAETLQAVDWHAVVLDEAQAIKNPASKAMQAASRLKAQHRFCLTGTPIENHLGELWSQASFLVPGFLGDHRRFARVFRTPIEKQKNEERRRLLARRVRPFVLRRTKAEVEAELPPRTEILRRVELAGEQRDLYETVRLAMHERVREAVAAKGFARSRIVILDALLKLRQVCCDPRLVKLASAKRAHASSAKLAYLMEMLQELAEGGSRILLFSQFTSMLDLIVPELDKLGLAFVELRGDTVDRATPVARFQAGEVPLFLLSLKAGGVGLNLTAADSVILYDPWWNPAVEAQAADRAHRIGQDKPVFVYKLIAEGTIEERMLELQEKKRSLAAGVLDEAGGDFAAFGEADLEALFSPLA
jgi:superfamily II DNA or RNA helicase